MIAIDCDGCDASVVVRGASATGAQAVAKALAEGYLFLPLNERRTERKRQLCPACVSEVRAGQPAVDVGEVLVRAAEAAYVAAASSSRGTPVDEARQWAARTTVAHILANGPRTRHPQDAAFDRILDAILHSADTEPKATP